MLTSDVNCLFTPRSEENNGKKTEIIDQPRFHADTHSTSQKCPLISSLTPLFDSTNYLALFRSYQRAIIHCQTFSVARGERNAHFSVLAPRLLYRSVKHNGQHMGFKSDHLPVLSVENRIYRYLVCCREGLKTRVSPWRHLNGSHFVPCLILNTLLVLVLIFKGDILNFDLLQSFAQFVKSSIF